MYPLYTIITKDEFEPIHKEVREEERNLGLVEEAIASITLDQVFSFSIAGKSERDVEEFYDWIRSLCLGQNRNFAEARSPERFCMLKTETNLYIWKIDNSKKE